MYIQRNVLKCKGHRSSEKSHRGTGHIRAPRREQDKKNGGAWERCSFGGLLISSLGVPGTLKLTSLHPENGCSWKLKYESFSFGFRPVFRGERFLFREVGLCSMVMSIWAIGYPFSPKKWRVDEQQGEGWAPTRCQIPIFFLIHVEQTGGGKNPEDYPPGN